MKKTEKVIVIQNGDRKGLINNTSHEIGHYMASVSETSELWFKQTDGQDIFKTQFYEIREVSDPEWLSDKLLPLIEKLAKNKDLIKEVNLQPIKVN